MKDCLNDLTVIIVSCNEGHYIEDCILSVLGANEILVFDMSNDEETRRICNKYSASLHKINKSEYVEKVRNETIGKAKNGWVLVLDPDERLPKGMIGRIKEIISDTQASGYYIPRKNLIFNRWAFTMDWWPDLQLRLYKKNCVSYAGVIHETPSISGVVEKFKVEEDNSIIHINYESVSQFISKMNRYTSAIAEEMYQNNKRFSLAKLCYMVVREFLKRYIYHRGYKQGMYGFMLSSLMANYYYQIYLKLWELSSKRSG